MTVEYRSETAKAGGLPSCFVRLLRKWRGSIYKLIYWDLVVFLGLFYGIALSYRFGLNEKQQRVFDDVVSYFRNYSSMIPLSFVLGFYVKIVVTRWWDQLVRHPMPDPLAMAVSSLLHGRGERSRKMRRTVMRYVCLSQALVYRMISTRAQKRFPTFNNLITFGLLTDREKKIIMTIDKTYPRHSKYWMPIVWASSILSRARKEGRIHDDFALQVLNDELNRFREYCLSLCHYDMISIPLVYTQTVTLACYTYFGCALIGHQWTHDSEFQQALIYVPFFIVLEFLFYMGWLKVAETLICPFGEDDDDFEVLYWMERNIRVSYLIVDGMHQTHPTLVKDQYWDYLAQDLPFNSNMPMHSTAHYFSPKVKMPNPDELLTIRQSLMRISHKPYTSDALRQSDAEAEERLRTLGPIKSLISTRPDQKQSVIAPIWPDSSQDSDVTLLSDSDIRLRGSFEDLRDKRQRQRQERHDLKLQETIDVVAAEQEELRRQSGILIGRSSQPLDSVVLRKLSLQLSQMVEEDRQSKTKGKRKRRKLGPKRSGTE